MHLSLLLSLMLVGASGYALYNIPSNCTCVFIACVFLLIHGLLNAIDCLTGKRRFGKVKSKRISSSIVAVAPIALLNMTLHKSAGNGSASKAHALFVVPLLADIIAIISDDACELSSTETLKTLNVLANVASLLFLALQQNNYVYVGSALAALVAYSGAKMLAARLRKPVVRKNVELIAHSAFNILMTMAIAEQK